jgi:hypothetical protein
MVLNSHGSHQHMVPDRGNGIANVPWHYQGAEFFPDAGFSQDTGSTPKALMFP